jgi:hypothetical protein
MTGTDAAAEVARGRKLLVGLAALFFVPLAFSFYLYYLGGWRPAGTTNPGELISPARPLATAPFTLPDGATPARGDLLTGKWTLMYIGDGTCAADCQKALWVMRQTRQLLAEDIRNHIVQRPWAVVLPVYQHAVVVPRTIDRVCTIIPHPNAVVVGIDHRDVVKCERAATLIPGEIIRAGGGIRGKYNNLAFLLCGSYNLLLNARISGPRNGERLDFFPFGCRSQVVVGRRLRNAPILWRFLRVRAVRSDFFRGHVVGPNHLLPLNLGQTQTGGDTNGETEHMHGKRFQFRQAEVRFVWQRLVLLLHSTGSI